MEKTSRIHRRLIVEELEPRATPVSLVGLDGAESTSVTRLGDLSLRYDFATPSLLEADFGGELLTIDGADLATNEGAPILPSRMVNLLLPQGTDLASVDLVTSDPICLGTFQPVIGTAPTLMSEMGAGDTSIQGVLSEDWAPQLYEVVGVQRSAGYLIASIMLHPILFDPTTTQAFFYSSMAVTIHTAAAPPDGEWVSRVRSNPVDRSHLEAIVDNPWVLADDGFPAGDSSGGDSSPPMGSLSLPSGSYDYVIITDSALESTFATLRDHKISQDVSTTIVTTSYIYDNYTGVDQAEQVRNFIRDAYDTWNVSYILLGGDIDMVPYRGAYASGGGETDTSMPCDLYFACLDGSWNGDGDAYWGEPTDGDGGGDVDLRAEVYVGRAPVSNDTQATNFINKTIQYETQAPPNPTHGLWIGEHLWDDIYGSYSKEPVREQAMSDDYTYTTCYEEEGTFSRANVIAGLNASPHVANHLGHANSTYVMGLSNSNVADLTNSYPFLVYSQGCNAGAFDRNDCISEQFVNSPCGAFASIMNSRYGWGSTSSTPAYSHDFDMAFFLAIFRDGQTNIGLANQLSKEYNIGRTGDGVYRWIYYELNLLGDPQTMLRTDGSSGPPPGDGYEVDDTPEQAVVIAADGAPQTHSIHVGTDVDWVKFTLAAASDVTIETNGASGDTQIWLYGPDSSSTLIEYDDDDGNDYFSRIVRSGTSALGPGTYYVKIDEYGNNDVIDSYSIAVSTVAGGWSEPVNLSEVNLRRADRSPTVSADGLTMWFSSARPDGSGGYDIWMATRPDRQSAWGSVVNVEALSSNRCDDDPCISPDGLTMWFSSTRSGGLGKSDIWMSTRMDVDSPWGEPTNVSELNSRGRDTAPCVGADGLTMWFSSTRRDGSGCSDLWMSTRPDVGSVWGAPAEVTEVNSRRADDDPCISADGLTLWFSSNRARGHDLYVCTRANVSSPWGEPMSVSNLNTRRSECDPALSADGSTIWFSSNRRGSAGSYDIWVSVRGGSVGIKDISGTVLDGDPDGMVEGGYVSAFAADVLCRISLSGEGGIADNLRLVERIVVAQDLDVAGMGASNGVAKPGEPGMSASLLAALFGNAGASGTCEAGIGTADAADGSGLILLPSLPGFTNASAGSIAGIDGLGA